MQSSFPQRHLPTPAPTTQSHQEPDPEVQHDGRHGRRQRQDESPGAAGAAGGRQSTAAAGVAAAGAEERAALRHHRQQEQVAERQQVRAAVNGAGVRHTCCQVSDTPAVR